MPDPCDLQAESRLWSVEAVLQVSRFAHKMVVVRQKSRKEESNGVP